MASSSGAPLFLAHSPEPFKIRPTLVCCFNNSLSLSRTQVVGVQPQSSAIRQKHSLPTQTPPPRWSHTLCSISSARLHSNTLSLTLTQHAGRGCAATVIRHPPNHPPPFLLHARIHTHTLSFSTQVVGVQPQSSAIRQTTPCPPKPHPLAGATPSAAAAAAAGESGSGGGGKSGKGKKGGGGKGGNADLWASLEDGKLPRCLEPVEVMVQIENSGMCCRGCGSGMAWKIACAHDRKGIRMI